MRKWAALLCISYGSVCGFVESTAFGSDPIIRIQQGARMSGMGGVRYTTGLYEDCFFGNPARATANPSNRLSVIDLSTEVTAPALGAALGMISNLTNPLPTIASTAGNHSHLRILSHSLEAYFAPGTGEGASKWAFAFSLLPVAIQTDVALRQSYQTTARLIVDAGVAFTVARKFDPLGASAASAASTQSSPDAAPRNGLSVGANFYPIMYRAASNPSYGVVQLIQGTTLNPLQNGGTGGGIDGDIGATYELPWRAGPFAFTVAGTVNQILGGSFTNFPVSLSLTNGTAPIAQNRSYAFGVSASRESWWKLGPTVFAFEVSDIGNNAGSAFRSIHLGAETRYSVFAFRAGLNQGYWTLGAGLVLRMLLLDLATYGEELSLNSGGWEDRRFVVRLGFPIQW